jgi:hypothetical protein
MIIRLTIFLITIVMITGNGFGQQSDRESKYRSSIKLSVISTRYVDKEEGLRKDGSEDTNIAIKLRLETKVGIDFLSFSNSVLPLGFVIEKRDGKNFWRAGLIKGEVQTSPGVGHWLDEGFKPYAWVLLTAHSAIEWEEYRNSRYNAGKFLANSVFVKDADDRIVEVMTDYYEVPARNR